jgi:hypothetical protein
MRVSGQRYVPAALSFVSSINLTLLIAQTLVKYTSEAAFIKHVSIQNSKKIKKEKQQVSLHANHDASPELPTDLLHKIPLGQYTSKTKGVKIIYSPHVCMFA